MIRTGNETDHWKGTPSFRGATTMNATGAGIRRETTAVPEFPECRQDQMTPTDLQSPGGQEVREIKMYQGGEEAQETRVYRETPRVQEAQLNL